MGRVHGPEGQIGEEGPVGTDGRGVVDEADGVVDQVLAQVVALVGGGRGLDAVVVVDQLGMELVGLALEEPVEAVEPPLAGPLVVGPGRRGVLHGAQVPLAHGEGGVALVPQHLGHGGGVVGDVAAHVGIAAVEVGERAHPHGVVVPPGEQRGPGGGAQRGHVEVGVAQPAGGQAVDVGGGQVGAVAAEVGEAGVVEEDDHHVGGALARVRRGGPPGRRLGLGALDHAVERSYSLGPLLGRGSGHHGWTISTLGGRVHQPPWPSAPIRRPGAVSVGSPAAGPMSCLKVEFGVPRVAGDAAHRPEGGTVDDGWRRRTSPALPRGVPGGGGGARRRRRATGPADRAPSCDEDGTFWLAYRLRRPVGVGRGYANVVARSDDGERLRDGGGPRA